ncbi:hypothetical protein [Streptomyces sp. JJ38]|uniref:hypothetical protein n=1 Tax=Streptomyces sp. JJ38 TaxID=2738128 RepID=UPI001C5802C3|nr:hypothetical protein [Streptomyces sp. JJ38]MBW1597399.1 hypothetical protein [Streptomyces sp. JJ38]
MANPQITLTMAGGSNTAKTAFIHSMYHRLSAGVSSFSLYSVDRDKEIGLLSAWKTLQKTGQMPRAGMEPEEYHFQFTVDFTPLVQVNWTDYRGGVVTEAATPAAQKDLIAWRQQLGRSDSVYLVMDGAELGRWIKSGTPAISNFASGGMDAQAYNWAIREAKENRKAQGEPPPSFVVLITKMDMLPENAGMPVGQALTAAVKNLGGLVRELYAPGVTALVCPVQIGDFKTEGSSGRNVDPSLIRPQNVHRPVCFTLWHYLTEALTAQQEQLTKIQRKITDGDTALSELQSKPFRSFRLKKIEAARADQQAQGLEKARWEAEISTTQDQANRLMREFDRLPLIKDGKLHVASDMSS